jgi:DNA-binding LacI/PurR family transcriptional regulator
LASSVTLKQIAEELGYSSMTVSRAINDQPNVSEKTKKIIKAKAREMGYTPNLVAKSLVARKTFTIGVVIPEIIHVFFPEVVRGIEEITNKFDYQLFLTNSDEQFEREKKSINALRAKRVDGLLISSSLATDDYTFYEEIIRDGPIVVFFDRCIENLGVSCVSVDDRASMQKITEHLIGTHGCRKIAYLSGPKDVSVGKERYEGFLDAMKKHNIPVKKHYIAESGFQEKKGYNSMKELLERTADDLPEAVVAVNDPCAIGAMDAVKDAGLSIPGDIAITGFTDDIRAPLLRPPLTTIHQPAYEVGKRAAQKLIATIEKEEEHAENIEVLTTLKVRNSCGCITNN